LKISSKIQKIQKFPQKTIQKRKLKSIKLSKKESFDKRKNISFNYYRSFSTFRFNLFVSIFKFSVNPKTN